MAWNEPGGNGDKDPWGNHGGNHGGNRGNNQGPPDLDELFRNIQKKFGSLFGKGGGGRRGNAAVPGGGIGLGLIAGVVLVAWIGVGLYEVEQAEVGIVLRFGDHVDVTQPGLHWVARPFESVEIVNIAERRQIPFNATVLTQDENIIDLQGTLQYQIIDAEKYLFNARDPDISLGQAVESAIRLNVGQSQMDYIITEGRNEITVRIKNTVQEIIDLYGTGLTVFEVNIQGVSPPEPVRQAFQDVIQAREDKQRLINEAEAYRNEVVPKARGAAARQREEADAYKQEVVARSEGEASRFTNLLKEYKKSPDVTRDRLYLDMMESVLSNSSKILVDVEGGNNLLYLPLDKLMERGNTSGGAVSLPDPLKDLQQREIIRRQTQTDSRGDLRTREIR